MKLLCALYKKFIIKVRKYGFLVAVSISSIVLHTTFHILSHDHTRNNKIVPELCILPVQNFTQVYCTGWKNVLNKLWQSPLECTKYQPTEMKCSRRRLKGENVVFNTCNRTVRPHIRMMIIMIITTMMIAPSPAYRHAR